MQIVHVIGARPNFMKVAPAYNALGRHAGIRQSLLHTGQHYDDNMNRNIFRDLDLPEPDVNLGVGSGSHARQTAAVMVGCEDLWLKSRPDIVMVYGDVNSTLAASLVAAKLNIPLAHVEAGLRSRDRTMPEEINRILTDQLSHWLFIPSEDARPNLEAEGIDPSRIHFIGNVMIDTLIRLLPKARALDAAELEGVPDLPEFGLVTLHRPSNVDDPPTITRIIESLSRIAQKIPLIFPVHPRTRKVLSGIVSQEARAGIHFVDPVSYLPFLALQTRAKLVITDSGGIQEETTYLRVPCLTLRENTERPITITEGTNDLIGGDMKLLEASVDSILSGDWKKGRVPSLWDGKAGYRLADILKP